MNTGDKKTGRAVEELLPFPTLAIIMCWIRVAARDQTHSAATGFNRNRKWKRAALLYFWGWRGLRDSS